MRKHKNTLSLHKLCLKCVAGNGKTLPKEYSWFLFSCSYKPCRLWAILHLCFDKCVAYHYHN